MLTLVLNMVMALAESKPCIAFMVYAYAAKLMWIHVQPITINKEQMDRFLVRLLYKIDTKNQIALNSSLTRVSSIHLTSRLRQRS